MGTWNISFTTHGTPHILSCASLPFCTPRKSCICERLKFTVHDMNSNGSGPFTTYNALKFSFPGWWFTKLPLPDNTSWAWGENISFSCSDSDMIDQEVYYSKRWVQKARVVDKMMYRPRRGGRLCSWMSRIRCIYQMTEQRESKLRRPNKKRFSGSIHVTQQNIPLNFQIRNQ